MPLKEELEKLFEKVREEEQGEYRMFILYQKGEPAYILCFQKSEGYLVGKIIPYSKTYSPDCHSIEYQPEGLYIVSDNINEFLVKLKAKTDRLSL
ncbi:hypothetical protein ACSU1N_01260 [Thermogladius sp. 4427co]|uniref:hypothetical protein n=1 Tax=Thermogladius sp. 4427co TaxID=3450718 RepID=UPI003F790862